MSKDHPEAEYDHPETATVREDSKGQKTVTIPKNSNLKGGDSIKFKPTESYGTSNLRKAVEKALDDYAAAHMPDYDYGQKSTIDVHVCSKTWDMDVCGYQSLEEKEVVEHIKEEHGDDGVEELKGKYRVVPVYELYTGLFTRIVRETDLENKNLYAENVINKLDEILDSSKPDERKLMDLADYVEQLAEKYEDGNGQ